MKHGDDRPLVDRPAGPAGTGPQERRSDLLPPDLPPGAVHYEATDVTVRPVAKSLLILVVATVAIVFLLYPMFVWFRGQLARADPAPPPMGRHATDRKPVEPRLQTTPVLDMAASRKKEKDQLKDYGWVDEQKGVVHIPIDVAMRMIVARGLPAAMPSASPGPGASPAPAPSAPPGAHP